MQTHNFKVIAGGIATPPSVDRCKFISAYATNTRLMGVVCMYAEWGLENRGGLYTLHQFFRFDTEDRGFERYVEMHNLNNYVLGKIQNSFTAGLGGSRVSLTEREVRALAQHYIAVNKKLRIALPAEYDKYAFLDHPEIALGDEEHGALLDKLCAPIRTPFGAVNYYLMRSFGNDAEATLFLSSDSAVKNPIASSDLSVLYKNTINTVERNGETVYISESLIDDERSYGYKMVVTETELDENLKVKSCKHQDNLLISPAEAAMQLSHSEFVTVYKSPFTMENFDDRYEDILANSTCEEYDAGMVYTIYNRENSHVEKSVFLLSGDICGIVVICSRSEQLVATANSLKAIRKLEKELAERASESELIPTGRYEFKEPVFYDFITYEYKNFEEFLKEL